MILHLLEALILLSLSFYPISARIFPNISSIPPGLLTNATVPTWDTFRKLAGCRNGQKLEGLDKLKKYFNHFGYISNSTSNFTNDFDEALESAIKNYQRNFNLNVSGELDEQTINQLVKPRCGNADIINGTSTMNSGQWTPFNTSLSQLHTVGHYTFFPGTPRWPARQRDLTYSFWSGNVMTADEKGLFARAFERWSAVIPMTFTEIDSFNAANIRIGFFNGDHGDGEPFDGILGTLAHAFSPPIGRLHFDEDENWVVSGDISSSPLLSSVDLESVAVHEIGHLLGLGHSSIEEAIMYPSISSRTRKVELAQDDIDGIQSLYGKNPNYTGSTSSSSTPSIQERETSGSFSVHSGWGIISLLLAIGFLFLLF